MKDSLHSKLWEEPARSIPIAQDVDVVVAGGGVAGMAAAYAAARNGARVLLVERNGFLGGTATAGIMPMLGGYKEMQGFARDFFARLEEMGGSVNVEATAFDVEPLKHLALQMLDEAGVEFMFYTLVTAPMLETTTDGHRVRGVVTESKSGRLAIAAHTVIDCTGDGDIAARAGAPFVKGRSGDGKMRPVTVTFFVGNIDMHRVAQYMQDHPEDFSPIGHRHLLDFDRKIIKVDGFFSLVEKAKAAGDLDPSLHYLRLLGTHPERGIAVINTTRVYGVDGTDTFDLTKGEIEARYQMMRVFNFVKKYVPGFEDSYVAESSSNIGVRETRHIQGRYMLTEDDIYGDQSFDDAVCQVVTQVPRGMTAHSPDGGEAAANDPFYRGLQRYPATRFQIPYRAFLPDGVEGMLVAGRCLSVTHEVDNSTRGMVVCFANGQAAGTAAALAARGGRPASQIDVSELQALLASQGMNLPRPVPHPSA